MSTRLRRPAASLCALALALAAPGAAAQDARHAGWEALREPGYRFDPDERPVLGFAVRASPAAREVLDRAESLAAAGDLDAAGRAWAAALTDFADEVVQVAGEPPRWVGVGEYALWQLLARIPEALRAELTSSTDAAALQRAEEWRDVPALRRLGLRLEGQPAARRALSVAARLLAEAGEHDAAAALAGRAALLGDGAPQASAAAPSAAPRVAPLPSVVAPHWEHELVVARLGPRNPFAQWPDPGEGPIAPIRPAIVDGVAYVADSISVTALDAISGRLLWHHAGPLETVAGQGWNSPYFTFDIYVDGWRGRAVSPFLCAEPLVAGERVFASVQALEPRRELHQFDRIPINWPLPRRQLVALQRGTGARLWEQGHAGPQDGDFLERFSVAGPPALHGGLLCAAGVVTQGALNSYAVALDPASGALVWRTLLCAGQQDLTMFNRPFQEHTASPALAADGAVYVSTNLGVVGCLDALSGRLRWLAAYETVARRASRAPEEDLRRGIGWLNAAPFLESGRLIVAPLDGTALLALDPSTGKELWSVERSTFTTRSEAHQALGTGDGRVLVLHDDRVECWRASDGLRLWSRSFALDREDALTGAAALVDGRLVQPTLSGALVLDLERRETLGRLTLHGGPAARGLRRLVPTGTGLLLTDNARLYGALDLQAQLADVLAREHEGPAQRLAAAELLLAAERLPEAEERYDLLLASDTDAERLARARTGRLETALRRARSDGGVARWEALLETARRLGRPWLVGREALIALEELGAHARVDLWLATLASDDPERRVDLGPLSPDGAQPLGLLADRRLIHGDAPEAAVARLQRLIEFWPDLVWDGRSVREQAARRIAALLEEHGAQLYAPWEEAARAALALGDDAASLRQVEERYPAARVVADARLARLQAELQHGRAVDVLEQVSALPGLAHDPRLAELRVRAARLAGEAAFADALGGTPSSPPTWLPRLPAGGARLSRHEITTRGSVGFPSLVGRPGPAFASHALGLIFGTGELFLFDAARAALSWRRPVPGGIAYPTPGLVELLAAEDRLFVHVFRQRRGGDGPQSDLLEAVSLHDGATLWSRELPGDSRGTAIAGGLVLRLDEDADGPARVFRLTGHGQASGARLLALDLPPCVHARLYAPGGVPVVFTARDMLRDGTPVGGRLQRVDLATGGLVTLFEAPEESPAVLLAVDEPPCLLLSTRAPEPGRGARLFGLDPLGRLPGWEAELQATVISRDVLQAGLQGRLLFTSLHGAGAVLQPIDARLGPQPGRELSAGVSILGGQSAGPSARLVLRDNDDPARLLVASTADGRLLHEVRLPDAPRVPPRVMHGRDGWLLVVDPLIRGEPALLRVFDADSGRERYSTVLDDLALRGRSEVLLAENAVLVANGGIVRVLRNDP